MIGPINKDVFPPTLLAWNVFIEVTAESGGSRSARRNLKLHAQSFSFKLRTGMKVQVTSGTSASATSDSFLRLHTVIALLHINHSDGNRSQYENGGYYLGPYSLHDPCQLYIKVVNDYKINRMSCKTINTFEIVQPYFKLVKSAEKPAIPQ